MRHIARPAALAALIALAGCVGAPAPGPYGYGYPPGYAQQPAFEQPQGFRPQPGFSEAGPPVGGAQVALGGTCYAGFYTCALPQALPVGAQCSCPGLGAPSFGNVR